MNKRLGLIVLVIFLALSYVSITTIYTAVSLVMLSEEQRSSDEWRINDEGKSAANNVQQEIAEQRQEIYNSDNAVISFVANLDNGVQELVAIVLILSPILWVWAVRSYNLKNKRRKTRKRGSMSIVGVKNSKKD